MKPWIQEYSGGVQAIYRLLRSSPPVFWANSPFSTRVKAVGPTILSNLDYAAINFPAKSPKSALSEVLNGFLLSGFQSIVFLFLNYGEDPHL